MQNYVAFLKLFYVTGFLCLVMELLQRYSFYIEIASHLEILKTMAFLLFSILLAANLLAGVSVVVSTLIGLLGYTDTYLKSVTELVCAITLGVVYTRSFMFLTAIDFYFPGYFRYRAIPLIVVTIIVFLRIRHKEVFNRWFYNIFDVLWKPLLALSLATPIWIGPSLITCSATNRAVSSGFTQSAPYGEKASSKPNIILITFDALSARDMSLYGYHRKTTPHLEEFARESLVFENMHANYTGTAPALISILTSKYPWTHGFYVSGGPLLKEKREENIAAVLVEYYTVAVVGIHYAHPLNLGLGTQFAHTQCDNVKLPRALASLESIMNKVCQNRIRIDRLPILERGFRVLPKSSLPRSGNLENIGAANETFQWAVQVLKGLTERPFFLWIHLFPTHHPYNVPSPFAYTFLPKNEEYPTYSTLNITPNAPCEPSKQPAVDKIRASYDEYILYADDALNSFIENLKELMLYDNSIIIVSADHGEIFEKGWLGHSSDLLFEPVIHIPLLIHLPGQSQGRRVSALAEQVDLAPTILDLLGKPIPSWMEGESLLPYIEGKSLVPKKAKFSLGYVGPIYKGRFQLEETIAVFLGDYKMICNWDTGEEQLYNLKKDRDESENLLRKEPDTAAQLRELITNLAVTGSAK